MSLAWLKDICPGCIFRGVPLDLPAPCEECDHGDKREEKPGKLSALQRIGIERARQITKEGWTPEHDDQHVKGEMATAAACYAMVPDECDERVAMELPDIWPETWSPKWWKPSPKNRIRELEKAGALIVAEIERLQRQADRHG